MTDTTPALDPALDPELAALLGFLAEAGHPPMWQETPADARAGFRTLAVDLRDPALLPEMATVSELAIPGPAGDLPARVYRPRAGDLPTLVFFHGGGWVIGDLDTHDLTCRTLARDCDAVVVSVDYRLAPEHRFPAAVDDAEAATRWVAERAADPSAGLGGTPVVAVGGDSAGGNLAAVVAQTLRDEGTTLAGQLLIYPATDVLTDHPSRTENAEGYFLDAPTMAWFLEQYLGDADPADPRLSPARGDVTGVAPAVVVVGQFDPLRDAGAAYARQLEGAGVPVELRTYPGLIHGFVDMGRYSRAAQAAIEETCALFRTVLHA
ncbi:alpha/beta hydrolase [Nocardioides sp. CER19]|uniref:alpha/beta hydrolase n=1 Tax=Nocardioides sp. CER19 TaxID=3038538 RepID=UPI00244BBC95|nr:alpha/beta hydrolase [Nocardioides sp. CER19]MDH2413541.1 alpha/beta hydrolase [Nocardioides sp. CER19]